jgi:hypothetical protein
MIQSGTDLPEIGTKIRRVRRRIPQSLQPTLPDKPEPEPEPEKITLDTQEKFLEYILKQGPDSLPKSTTTQRYSTETLEFSGTIPEGLYHIFGVAKDLLGTSYRPKECNLMVGKIHF